MKNRLYISLLTIVGFGSVMGSSNVVERMIPDTFPVKEDMLGAGIGSEETESSSMLGHSKSTYAPSELENTLRRRSQALYHLARTISAELNELANALSFFRQNEPKMFKEYFDTKEMDSSFELDMHNV